MPLTEFSGFVQTKPLLAALTEKKFSSLSGLRGSSFSFLAAKLFEITDFSFVIICSDKEKSAYIFNELVSLCGEDSVLYFPESAKTPYRAEEVNNANIQQRAEILNTINQSARKKIFVTTPRALYEKVIAKGSLSKVTLEIKTGEKLSPAFVSEFLQEYNFERKDFVLEPGQFSIRGGIVDIFSWSNDKPYRFELFGDEVESIRTFDPVTQLSLKTYHHITLIPDIHSPELSETIQPFTEYLKKDTVIFGDDFSLILHLTEKFYEKAEKEFIALPVTVQKQPAELFIDKLGMRNQLMNFAFIEFSGSSPLRENNIAFHQDAQPVFNKNFEMLFKNLEDNKKKGYKNYLLTESVKQAERLQGIFTDMGLLTGHTEHAFHLFEPLYLNLHEGFIDHELKIAAYTDHQIFERYHKFYLKENTYKKAEALTLKEIQSLSPGDYVTHIDHGIGRFAGLEKMMVNGKQQEAVRIVYKDNDILLVSVHSLHRISKYSGKEGNVPRIDKLGSTHWQTLKQKTKKKVKEIAYNLIHLYAKRKTMKGHAFARDNYLQAELEASFIYEDTPDQLKSTNDVKKDMEKPYPMDRLVCGDVGFGKTEIAIRAAFKAVCDNKQVAVLVPTTILALQHYKTFSERLKNMPCNIDYINRFKTAKEQKESLEKLVLGKTDIIIGTHKLAGKEVKFKDLGLLIIDEEQKFGVAVKDKLKTLKANVDTLTLTATPIPRTLQFSLMGARDLSVIATPPPNRYPIQTDLSMYNEEVIRDAVHYEIKRGGQVFFVHNKVQNLQEIAGMISRLVPDARVAIGHGQMDGDKLEETMLAFIEGYFDVLVATTIVESGLDIPNANTIIINDAQNFGLSDLHQMRGRVGRSNKKAFCYLLVPSLLTLTSDARKRLKAITEFTELGSGFQVAMRDLDIRGAGNLLGGEQSGFINDMGFETYMKILSEAMEELKEEDWYKKSVHEEDLIDKSVFSRSFVKETQLETDLELLIPESYVTNLTERLTLYRELDDITKEKDLMAFENNLRDRFGPLPKQVSELINVVRLRWLAMESGFEKIILKNSKMILHFLSKPDSPYFSSPQFAGIMSYVQKNSSFCSLKEGHAKLTLGIDRVREIYEAIDIFAGIKKEIRPHEQKA
jgi:transcription-repair coupling factor (superfamily II helicase)